MKTSCSVCGSRRLELPAGGRKVLNPGPKCFPKLRGRHTAFSNGIGAVVTFFVLSVFVVLHASSRSFAA